MTGTKSYATSVVEVLCAHFPHFADPVTAEVVTEAIERQARDPHPGFEVIVDDPITAKWRLKPDNQAPRRVLLFIIHTRHSEADAELSRTVNDALRAL